MGTIRIKSRIRNGNRMGRRREAYIKVRFKRTVYRLISANNAPKIAIPMKEPYHEETEYRPFAGHIGEDVSYPTNTTLVGSSRSIAGPIASRRDTL
jgi:hypothetical protein